MVGARPRREARASGLAVGAVNALLVNGRGEVLLQRRPPGKDNGERWDKSVGGHVSAGEDFDTTVLRETGEELFDDAGSTQVKLAASPAEFDRMARAEDLGRTVLLERVSTQLCLRDVRVAPGGGIRNVLYHLAIYHGRTAIPIDHFRPQKSEIAALRYASPEELDQLLLDGRMPANRAFLWLTQGHALLRRHGPSPRG